MKKTLSLLLTFVMLIGFSKFSLPVNAAVNSKYDYDKLMVQRGLVAYLNVSDIEDFYVTEDTTLDSTGKTVTDGKGNSVRLYRIKSGVNPTLYADGSVKGIFQYYDFLEEGEDYTVELNAKLDVASYDGKTMGYFGALGPYLNAKSNGTITFRYYLSNHRTEKDKYSFNGYKEFSPDTGVTSGVGFHLTNVVDMTELPFYYTDDEAHNNNWIAANGVNYLGESVSGRWVGIDADTLSKLGDTVTANTAQWYLNNPDVTMYKSNTSQTYYAEKYLNDADVLSDLGYESVDALKDAGYSLYGPGKYDGYIQPKLYINTEEYTSASIYFPYSLNASKSGKYSYNATNVLVGNDEEYRIYSYRIYNVTLTEDEIKQNNLADMARTFKWDMSIYDKLSAEDRTLINEELAKYNMFSDKETVTAEFTALCNERNMSSIYDTLVVNDGLIASLDVSSLDAGSYAKNTTATDELGNTITFTTATTVNNDGYFNGQIRWKEILSEESDYTVQTTARMKNTSSVDFATLGLQKLQLENSVENNLTIRADASAWRAQNTTKYDNFKYTSSMYGYTIQPYAMMTDGKVESVLTATFDVTPKDYYYSQTKAEGLDWYEKDGVKYIFDHTAKTVSTNKVTGGFVGLTQDEYTAIYSNARPVATELHWYADGTDAVYTKDIPENPVKEEGQKKYGPGIGDGYFTSVIYNNAEEVSGTRLTMPYVLSETGIYGNNGTNVTVGNSTTYDIYSVRIYNRILTKEEMQKNNFADLVNKFYLDISDFITLSVDEQKEVISQMAKYTVFDNKETVKSAFAFATNKETVRFDGYQVKMGDDTRLGLRALFSVDSAFIENLEAEGYTVELGAIMAKYQPGRTHSDITIAKNESGILAPAGENMIAGISYKTGEENNYLYNDEGDPENLKRFAYAVIYGEKTEAEAKYIYTDLMFRAYLAATDSNGETKIFYFDALTDSMLYEDNDCTSLAEVSYILSQTGYADEENIKAVLAMMETSKEMKTVYYTTPAIPAQVGKIVDLSCYNVQMTTGFTSPAEKLTWSSDEIEIQGSLVPVTEKGVFALNVTDGVYNKTVYIVSKLESDTEYVLYETDFTDFNSKDIEIINQDSGATYSVENGILKINTANSKNSMLILLPEYAGDFGDYTISAKTRFTSTNASSCVALVGRMQGDSKTYGRFLVKSVTTSSGGTELKEVNGSMNVSKVYSENFGNEYRTISLDMSGHNATGYIDQTEVISASNNNNYPVGRTGIYVNSGDVEFDNFKITIDFDAAANYSYSAANTTYTESNIALAPSVIQKIESSADLYNILNTEPTSAMMNLNSDLQITDTDGNALCSIDEALASLENRVIPVFRLTDETQTNALAKYLSDSNYRDIMVVSTDDNLITQLRKDFRYAKGILEITEDTQLTNQEIVETANVCNASVVLLPLSMADSKTTAFFHTRGITVWHCANIDTTVNTFRMITSGTSGVVTSDAKLAKECLANEMFAVNSLIRPANIVGHRGIPSLANENTVSGALLAANLGANIVETDLRLTKDGIIVMMHDSTLDRTTNGTGNVKDYTYEELKKLVVDSYNTDNPSATPIATEPIPTLEDYLKAFKDMPEKILYLEVKDSNTQLINGMVELINKYDMADQCCVISFNANAVVDIRENIPTMSGLWLCKEYAQLDYVLNATAKYNSSYETYVGTLNNVGFKGMAYPFYRGAPLWVYTANGSTLDNYILHGVFGITTDNVDKVSNYLKFAYTAQDTYAIESGSATQIELIAETYSTKTVTPANAQMFVISGNTNISFNAETNTITTTDIGTSTVVFRIPFTIGSKTAYVFTQPVTVNAN